MSDFRTTCSLFSKEYFGEELTTEKVSRDTLADVAGYAANNAPNEARIVAVGAVKDDLNNRGIGKYDEYLLNLQSVYTTIKNRNKNGMDSLTTTLRSDIDQNFKNFLKGVDGSAELSNLL